jgi:ribosomal protein L6P/L9E
MGKLGSTYIEKEPFITCNKTGEFLECSFTLEGVSRKQANITNRKFSQFLSNLKTSLKGVSSGFYIELSLKGVGYRFLSYKDNILVMKVGFCNNVSFEIPKGVEIFIESPTQLTLFSIDYSLLKQVATSLRG